MMANIQEEACPPHEGAELVYIFDPDQSSIHHPEARTDALDVSKWIQNDEVTASETTETSPKAEDLLRTEGTFNLVDQKEAECGITEFVNSDHVGLSGVFKKRYTDFLVNEVGLDGAVVHLRTIAKSDDPAFFAKGNEGLSRSKISKKSVKSDKDQTMASGIAESDTLNGQSCEKQDVRGSEREHQTKSSPASAGQEVDASNISVMDPQNMAPLLKIVDKKTVDELQDMYNRAAAATRRNPGISGEVIIAGVTDKDVRSSIHHSIRETFGGRLRSNFDEKTGSIVVKVGTDRKRGQRRSNEDKQIFEKESPAAQNASIPTTTSSLPRKRTHQEAMGEDGEYLHFSVEKTNRDTIETVNYFAKVCKLPMKKFGFAGTKDRRGVTVQRVSGYKLRPTMLRQIQKQAKACFIGDWEYRKEGLRLGDLRGNEFIVTLRDVKVENQSVAKRATDTGTTMNLIYSAARDISERIMEHGFINYFGRQRFGTYNVGTHQIGTRLLRGEFEQAVEGLLAFQSDARKAGEDEEFAIANKIGKDDAKRALGIDLWKQGKHELGIKTVPPRFGAEVNVMRHLSKSNKHNDFWGAFQTISRNQRLLYVHAYQSLIWNLAASYRHRNWGNKVLEGDLVLVKDHEGKEPHSAEKSAEGSGSREEVDADGEVIVHPDPEDRAFVPAEDDDRFERARALTAYEAASGRYSIFDIVLPTPGFDILYPSYMLHFYKDTMGKEENGSLNPLEMRRKWSDLSLPGSYRKLMARPEDGVMNVIVKEYVHENEQFVDFDSDVIMKERGTLVEKDEGLPLGDGKKIAMILKFRLGTSQYATMMLREFMKGGLIDFHVEFSGGR